MDDNGVCDRNMCKISPPTKLEKNFFQSFRGSVQSATLQSTPKTFMRDLYALKKKVTKKISQNRLKISCVKSSENRLGNSSSHQ